MPTRNRRSFIGQAIWYFLRQDYAEKELVVLDDGEDAVADLIPDDRRIRYERLPQRVPLGKKRNLACELSRGDLIAHWDDDDWIAPNRLSVQVAALLDSDRDICGARDLLHYKLDTGEAWLYRYPESERPWLAGCTLLYRRSVWAGHAFPDLKVGEDGAFLWQLPPDQLHTVPDLSLFVALIHPRNTGAKHLAGPQWERRPVDEVSRLLAFDRDFYVALRNGHPNRNPIHASPSVPTITVGAQFDVTSGYGSMAEYLVLGMEHAGATVHVSPLSLNLAGMTEEFREIVRRSRPDPRAPVLYFSWPRTELERFRAASDLFINTMWESSRLPRGWVEQLNRARAVIVPTHFVARVCRDSGVTVPIEVIPEGINPDVYHHVERPERPGLTALTIGPIDDRKHVPVGIAAWNRVFAEDPDARLIIKTQYNYQNYIPDDPRIKYVDTEEPTRGIMHWYRQADVLLALGNEGFGLPLVEGMATGLPVIALDSEGQADVCQVAGDHLLSVEPAEWQPYDNRVFGRCGIRGIPSVDDVAERLRWVADHLAEAREIGRAASEWAIENRNIWAKGPAVLDVMEQHTRPPRPLRRTRTIWTPTWGSPCGVAEYTAHLIESMPSVRVARDAPDMRGMRLLQVQHHHTLFGDGDLTRVVQQARQAQIPVVVTEHAVWSYTRAWEREVEVLVSLTQAGSNLLQKRWPSKRIEHIPHGCPTWFPPRKQSRGRVLGTFGFLEEHKGFWDLLDVLREQPGTELLAFSYAKSTELEARWTEAIKGLAVRWVGSYLPEAEIARRLAAEADALVFWYHDVPDLAASGAVQIGLATGVPVLTSPTGWFTDVQEQTFQPANLNEGVERLLDDTPLRTRMTAAARDYCHDHSWPRIAERHLALWDSLEHSTA